MTSISINASRTRAGMLIVAMALVGGTGCITSAIVQNVQEKNRLREMEDALQKNIARLTPLADAGDAASNMALARELLAVPASGQVDQIRVFALLSQAADKGYGPAQALLGETMLTGEIRRAHAGPLTVGPGFQDRERGLALLRQAATQACRFKPGGDRFQLGWIAPAMALSRALERTGRPGEAWLWRGRAALHCGQPTPDSLSWQIAAKDSTPRQRIDALALIMLTDDATRAAKADATMTAEDIANAGREAFQLRQRVAESEREYPAPKQKEMQ